MSEAATILIVDDDSDIRRLISLLLTARNYQTFEAANGTDAVDFTRAHPDLDLIIMDIMMPEQDGISACRAIRSFSTAPILFLTAKTKETDMSSAFDSGGDDYLPKPFSQSELLMRVTSLLRRYRVYRGKAAMLGQSTLVIDEDARKARCRGEYVDLTDKEFDILCFLTQRRGKVVDVKTLYEGVWGEKYLSSSTNTIMVHILNLRKKLELNSADPQIIRTIWGKGYEID